MTAPPGNENATGKGGVLKTDDAEKINDRSPEGKLWPLNVSWLDATGIPFEWRRVERNLILVCPICGGKAAVHENQPWFYCGGDIRCRTRGMRFEQIISALVKVRKT